MEARCFVRHRDLHRERIAGVICIQSICLSFMKIAFVFPGQGSQSVGMLDAWADNAAVNDVVGRASAALGQDLAALISSGPAEELNRSEEHTSELQSLMRISYAVFCLKKKK